jgi:hypothetical protein
MPLCVLDNVYRIRTDMPKVHSNNVSDLSLRLFVRDCTQAPSVPQLVYSMPTSCDSMGRVIEWGSAHVVLLDGIITAVTLEQMATAITMANEDIHISRPSPAN